MLRALADNIQYANICGTDNIRILKCPVHILSVVLQDKLSVIIDVQSEACASAGVIDGVTLFISYLLVNGTLVLYSGLLQHRTKPAGSGLIIKLTITLEV